MNIEAPGDKSIIYVHDEATPSNLDPKPSDPLDGAAPIEPELPRASNDKPNSTPALPSILENLQLEYEQHMVD